MKKSTYSQNRNVLEQRLKHLAAFSGLPHWSFSAETNRAPEVSVRIAKASRKGFAAALVKKTSDVVKHLKERFAAKRLLRENLRELRNLNSHQLQDIGLHPGDIAAIVNGVQTVESVNAAREKMARPACKVIELDDIKAGKKPAKEFYLVDNAA